MWGVGKTEGRKAGQSRKAAGREFQSPCPFPPTPPGLPGSQKSKQDAVRLCCHHLPTSPVPHLNGTWCLRGRHARARVPVCHIAPRQRPGKRPSHRQEPRLPLAPQTARPDGWHPRMCSQGLGWEGGPLGAWEGVLNLSTCQQGVGSPGCRGFMGSVTGTQMLGKKAWCRLSTLFSRFCLLSHSPPYLCFPISCLHLSALVFPFPFGPGSSRLCHFPFLSLFSGSSVGSLFLCHFSGFGLLLCLTPRLPIPDFLSAWGLLAELPPWEACSPRLKQSLWVSWAGSCPASPRPQSGLLLASMRVSSPPGHVLGRRGPA